MKIYFIRHGESENNLLGRWTGWHDAALTEKGISDAIAARKILSCVKFDKVFSSDLSRAVKTASTALPSHEIETTMLLREIDVGELTNQPLSAMTYENKMKVFTEGYADFSGESRDDFYKRIESFIDSVRSLECENIAAFTHGGWMMGVLDVIFGMTVPRKAIICENCAVAVFNLEKDGSVKLHSWINI